VASRLGAVEIAEIVEGRAIADETLRAWIISG